jgi:hypothetical protein
MHEEVQKIYSTIFLSLYPKISAIASGAAGVKLMAPEVSLCVVNDQPVGNPKRKV